MNVRIEIMRPLTVDEMVAIVELLPDAVVSQEDGKGYIILPVSEGGNGWAEGQVAVDRLTNSGALDVTMAPLVTASA